MKAAILHDAPGDLVVEDVTIDAPIGREVLIRTKASGLCHSDLHVMDALLPIPLPAALGHEAAGLVEAIGPEVTAVRPGDHVITCITHSCGGCTECLNGRIWVCERRQQLMVRGTDTGPRLRLGDRPVYQLGGLGAFAEQILAHESAVVAIDPAMPLDAASLIGCAVLTGVGSAINGARIRPGETVVVIGCGGIGLNIVQGSRLAGAGRIIAVDLEVSKLEAAKGFGATDVVDASACDPVEAVLDLTGGVDAAFEAIGLTATAEQALAMVRPGRTAYLVGVPPATSTFTVSGTALVMQAKGVQGLFMGNSSPGVEMPRLVDHYLNGRLEIDRLISARITLDEVNDGYEALRSGGTLRSVILFD